MGFFDSFIDENASASSTSTSSGSSSGSPAAVAEAPKKISLKKTNDSDFLIIDDSVTADTIPDTVSGIFAPETAKTEETAIITFNEESPIVSESSAATGVSRQETIESIEASVSDAAIIAGEVIKAPEATEAAMVEEIAEVAETATIEEIPEPVATTEVAEVTVEETSEVAEAVKEEEVVAPAIDTFFSSPVSMIEEAPVAAIVSADSSETAVRQAMEKIAESIRAKESSRDAKISENERILAQIADLKKLAKSMQDEAREIDKSADHDRKLVEGLKTLIAA